MKNIKLIQCLFLFVATFFFGAAHAKNNSSFDNSIIEGRWDLTIAKDGKQLPSWLEVQHSGTHTLIGRFVYAFGSARPIAEIKMSGNHFSFSIPVQWEPGNTNMEFEGDITAGMLVGSMLYTDGKKYNFSGSRAPLLDRSAEPVWDSPIALIGKTDMNEWHAEGANQWTVKDGVLTSAKSGSNLISNKTFNDFKLHVEFKYPKGSNSGVYLRGRYEVQIVDSKGIFPWNDQFSAIYGFLPPNVMAAKDPGEWQTYDITLVGRTVTVIANGKTVICGAVIPGITGGALDSKEGEAGPIFIQGDHGPIEYRNIIITPAK